MEATFDPSATADLGRMIGQWDQGASCLAALAVVAGSTPSGDATAEPLVNAARNVVNAAGLAAVLASPHRLPFSPAQLRGMAASPLLQAAALAGEQHAGWAANNDATLIAQGHASGSTAALFTRFVLPHFSDLRDRLATPGSRMLDVGTGVGALAIGFAQAFPQLHVTGIDVLPRAVAIARDQAATSPAASRVTIRQQDVAELTDEACYDLAWIPAPFVPEPAFSAGVARIATALAPGGILMIGHGTSTGSDLQIAITQFKTALYGGTLLDGASAVKLLQRNGLTSAQTMTTPPGAPAITVGQRQAQSQ